MVIAPSLMRRDFSDAFGHPKIHPRTVSVQDLVASYLIQSPTILAGSFEKLDRASRASQMLHRKKQGKDGLALKSSSDLPPPSQSPDASCCHTWHPHFTFVVQHSNTQGGTASSDNSTHRSVLLVNQCGKISWGPTDRPGPFSIENVMSRGYNPSTSERRPPRSKVR